LGRYHPSSPALDASRSPIKPGTFSPLKHDRPWRQVAGPAADMRLATVRADVNPNDVHGLLGLYTEAIWRGDTAEADRLHLRVKTLYPHIRKEHMRQMYLRYRNPEHQAVVAERINLAVHFPE
jgi:hypothetical protein